MVHNISQMKSKASQGRSLGGFWSQIARNKCAILILALKLPLLEWSQSHNLCSTAHLKVETRCFLVCFSSGKKKKIRTLDEICNPSYTNLRSPRRFYNLIPKQAAKKGNSPGEKKRLSFLSFFLLCLNFWDVFLGFLLFTWVLPLPLPITERLPALWRWPWCSCSRWTWESASPPSDAPQCDEGCKGRHSRATCGYRQFVRLHYHKLCGSAAGVRGQCGFQLKLPIEDGFMFGLFQNTLGCNLSFKLSSWKHFPFLVQRV